ncbi:hypothetical protein MTP99_013959 [Tenebrio molitor]|nr:hypothetical protein MTP99_013959 [Tenebrio molitor]
MPTNSFDSTAWWRSGRGGQAAEERSLNARSTRRRDVSFNFAQHRPMSGAFYASLSLRLLPFGALLLHYRRSINRGTGPFSAGEAFSSLSKKSEPSGGGDGK